MRDSDFEDLSGDWEEHVEDVHHVAAALMAFHAKREETYQMSFAKRGMIGIWQNLGRKIDRLDPLARQYFQTAIEDRDMNQHARIGRMLVDTLADIAIYSMKWLAMLALLQAQDNRDYGLVGWVKYVFAPEMDMTYDEAYAMFRRDYNRG